MFKVIWHKGTQVKEYKNTRVQCFMDTKVYSRYFRVWSLQRSVSKLGWARLAKSGFYRFCRTHFKKIALFVQFSAKFLPYSVQIKKYLKNSIFTACKWCKLRQYYVNSMVLSCITCQKEEKECTWVDNVIYAVLPQF